MTLKNIDKNVIIKIKNLQTIDGSKETTELITEGNFYEQNGKQYIFYDEVENPGEKVMIIIDDNDVVLTRRGEVVSKMHYCEGNTERVLYHTPYGSMTMVLRTLQVDNRLSDHRKLHLIYELCLNDEFFHNDLTITIKSRKGDYQ